MARDGHNANKIDKLMKLPKAADYRVCKQFKEKGNIYREGHKPRSNQMFRAGHKCSIEANAIHNNDHCRKKRQRVHFHVVQCSKRALGMISYH